MQFDSKIASGRHGLKSFGVTYCSVVLASALVMTLTLAGTALLGASWNDISTINNWADLPLNILTVLILFTIGASVLVFPSLIVGYPTAVWIAKRHPPLQTTVASAVIAPIACTAVIFFSEGGHTERILDVFKLLPGVLSAGAMTGFMVSGYERRK
jgi:ABC-type spermidine/putrescine transport system permease subunit I